jgi:hypothetical protein
MDGGDKYGRVLCYLTCATCGQALNDALLSAKSTGTQTAGMALALPMSSVPNPHVYGLAWARVYNDATSALPKQIPTP